MCRVGVGAGADPGFLEGGFKSIKRGLLAYVTTIINFGVIAEYMYLFHVH